MKELWHLHIAAREQGIDPDSFCFITEGYSPYYPVALGSFNLRRTADYRGQNVSVNPYIRYDRVFDALLRCGQELPEHRQFLTCAADAMLHVLCETEILEGLSRRELELDLIAEDLRRGALGDTGDGELFSRWEYLQFANCLLLLCETGEYVRCFLRALAVSFPNSYAERRDTGELLVFLSCEKTAWRERQVQYLLDFFLQIHFTYTIYWDRLPGIIGYPETMRLETFLLV